MSQIEFFIDNTNFWLAAVGWEGRIAYIKSPMFQKNTYTIPIILKQSVHIGDIYALDHIDNYAATGGIDNKICIWNSLSGTVRTLIELPKEKPNIFICQVKFVKTPT